MHKNQEQKGKQQQDPMFKRHSHCIEEVTHNGNTNGLAAQELLLLQLQKSTLNIQTQNIDIVIAFHFVFQIKQHTGPEHYTTKHTLHHIKIVSCYITVNKLKLQMCSFHHYLHLPQHSNLALLCTRRICNASQINDIIIISSASSQPPKPHI